MVTQHGRRFIVTTISFPLSFVRHSECSNSCLCLSSPPVTRILRAQRRESLGSHEDNVHIYGTDLFCLCFALRYSPRGLGTHDWLNPIKSNQIWVSIIGTQSPSFELVMFQFLINYTMYFRISRVHALGVVFCYSIFWTSVSHWILLYTLWSSTSVHFNSWFQEQFCNC